MQGTAAALRYGNLALESALEGGEVDFAIFWRLEDAVETLERGERLMHAASGSTVPNFQYGAAQLMYALNAYDEGERRIKAGRFVPDRLVAILANMRALIAVACPDRGSAGRARRGAFWTPPSGASRRR